MIDRRRSLVLLLTGISTALGCSSALDAPEPADATETAVAGCVTAAPGKLVNAAFGAQSTPFSAEWDVTPSGTVDAAVGLSDVAASGWSGLAAIVRFTTTIDVRNGGVYAADRSLAVVANRTYHVRVVVTPATHRYSVWVTPAGGAETQVARDYAFRSEKGNVTRLASWVVAESGGAGSLAACAFMVKSAGAATPDAGPTTPDAGPATPDAGPGVPPAPPPSTLFPADATWYKDVSSAPVAAQSASIIDAIGAWGNGNHFDVDFAFNVVHANAATPRYTAKLDSGYDPDNDHVDVPVPASGALENESGYTCTTGGDCHLIVVDDAQHLLFELWQANFANGRLTATQESAWSLLTHYGPRGRGYGCTSADAAGLPILAGVIGVRETHAGHIDHAIRFILPNSKIRSAFVAPATHLTSAASSTSGPPYGTRLRLRASFDESRLPSEGARIVARALKKYGMILADGGQTPISAERDQLYGADMKWAGLLGAFDLRSVTPQDFDVVDFGTPRFDRDCVRTP